MSFNLQSNVSITTIQRRTADFYVQAQGLLGDSFAQIAFRRESIYMDGEGNIIYRVLDPEEMVFTPDTVAQDEVLQLAISTIYQYLDGADPQLPAPGE